MAVTKALEFVLRAKNKSGPAFRGVKKDIATLNKGFLGLKATIAGALGVGSFSIMAKGAADTADRIHKLGLRLGTSAEAMSQYRHVADMSGVSFDTFAMGLQRMVRRVNEASQGFGEAQGTLEELGIEAGDLTRMRPAEQFEMLADALMGIPEPAERVQKAMKLFDSEGVSLLQMMQGGSEGISELRKQADDLGMTMGQEMVENIASMNDSLQRMISRITSLVEQIVGHLAPDIDALVEKIGAWIDKNKDMIQQDMVGLFKRLHETAKVLIPILDVIGKTFKFIGEAIGLLIWKTYQWAEKLKVFTNLAEKWQRFKDSFTSKNPYNTSTSEELRSASQGNAEADPEIAEMEAWADAAMQGPTIVNNFNQQYTRSDAVAMATEMDRQGARQ